MRLRFFLITPVLYAFRAIVARSDFGGSHEDQGREDSGEDAT
jgi:hypothetical protein